MKNQLFFLIFIIGLLTNCMNLGTRTNNATTKNEKTFDNGYSQNSSKNYTGSADEVKELGSNITLDAYLRRVSGVTVTGDGANANIRVRGINTFMSDPSPLFVINGNAINGGYSAVYNMVSPNDIKSVTVLKDASSTAIYGSRASNGVIVISLKKQE